MAEDAALLRDDAVDGVEPTPAAAVEGPGAVDLVLAAAAFLLLVAYGPGMFIPTVTVRSLVLWPVGGAGLVALIVHAIRGDRAARWASAFLLWALLAAVVAPDPVNALFAAYGADRGWVFLACCLGCWALGRGRGRAGAELLIGTVVAGLAANALVALIQAPGDGIGLFAMPDGRATGFADNPIFLGALMAGGMALGASLTARASERWWAWLFLVGGATAVANLSGSRIALVAGAVICVAAVVSRNPRRVVGVLLAVVLGLALSWNALDAGSTERIASDQAGSGFEARALMWQAGLEAAGDRPVFGWGPGRFLEATSFRTTDQYVRAEAPDRLFAEAHNELVEILVTTGVPGLVLVLGFAWAVVTGDRRARGPLAWFTAAIAATWLLQPTSATTAAVALLALGYAGAGDGPPADGLHPAGRRVAVVAAVILALVGGVAGVRLVASDRDVRVGMDQSSPAAMDRAAARFPADPYLAYLRTHVLTQDAFVSGRPERERAALAAARRGTEVDRSNPNAWIQLGAAEAGFGAGTGEPDEQAARRAFHEALDLSPWSVQAMLGLWRLDRASGDDAAAAGWSERLCRIGACPSTS